MKRDEYLEHRYKNVCEQLKRLDSGGETTDYQESRETVEEEMIIIADEYENRRGVRPPPPPPNPPIWF